ncbi:hypothetical protein K0M31_003548 [Melipona bicolor]|uniref:Uncharacterized protein n=1 Tax=Melipona bicolor TaxID=60889 RepID=A0AA40FZU7_9HYME|nr:hypothetical protein K0M31_003548 [Melipona bicolor]
MRKCLSKLYRNRAANSEYSHEAVNRTSLSKVKQNLFCKFASGKDEFWTRPGASLPEEGIPGCTTVRCYSASDAAAEKSHRRPQSFDVDWLVLDCISVFGEYYTYHTLYLQRNLLERVVIYNRLEEMKR